jgi:crossover junction endodeoxyribonuclease RuvC
MRVILGLDPGLAQTGYGLIALSGGRCVHICHGVIGTSADMELGERLEAIYDGLEALIRTHGPGEASIEGLYFSRNATSAIPVAQARGVALLVCARNEMSCFDYTHQAIKKALVGTGRAEKAQVQNLVRILLGLGEIPEPDHAADALAAAICHAHTHGVLGRV